MDYTKCNCTTKDILTVSENLTSSWNTYMGNIPLLPCPFCGEKPKEVLEVRQNRGITLRIMCDSDGHPQTIGFSDTIEDSAFSIEELNIRIKALRMVWNYRPKEGDK